MYLSVQTVPWRMRQKKSIFQQILCIWMTDFLTVWKMWISYKLQMEIRHIIVSLVFYNMQMEDLHVCHRQEFVNNRKAYIYMPGCSWKNTWYKIVYRKKQLSILLIQWYNSVSIQNIFGRVYWRCLLITDCCNWRILWQI